MFSKQTDPPLSHACLFLWPHKNPANLPFSPSHMESVSYNSFPTVRHSQNPIYIKHHSAGHLKPYTHISPPKKAKKTSDESKQGKAKISRFQNKTNQTTQPWNGCRKERKEGKRLRGKQRRIFSTVPKIRVCISVGELSSRVKFFCLKNQAPKRTLLVFLSLPFFPSLSLSLSIYYNTIISYHIHGTPYS